MERTRLQKHLNSAGFYNGKIDGIIGPQTRRSIDAFLSKYDVAVGNNWDSSRKIVAAEQLVYKNSNIEVGAIDGLVGPQTLFAREQYDHLISTGELEKPWREKAQENPESIDKQPRNSDRWPLQKNMISYYGPPGTNHTRIQLPFTMKIAWDLSQTVNSFIIHEKCHDSALKCFKKIHSAYSPEDISKHGFDLFGGCFNNRKMRGGRTLSTHAYAAAIDFDPIRNQLRWDSSQAYLARPECEEFWRIWESEGWVSLGRTIGKDYMHTQAARL